MRGTFESFRAWLLKARRNDRFVYYLGSLMVDRGPESKDMRSYEQHAVTLLAISVFAAQTRGVVALTQKRLADDLYVYYATKL